MKIARPFTLFCLLLLPGLGCQTQASQPVQFCQDVTLPAPVPGAERVSVWVQSARWHCWRAYLPALAAEANDLPVSVETKAQNTEVDFFWTDLMAAAEAGSGPDITIQTGSLEQWVEAGHLAPLDECLARHAAFDQIPESLWSTAVVDEQTYGVPLDVHLYLLFFNKSLLKEVGWSDAQIAALPQQIAAGHFTLFDLLDVAQQAVAQGVIEPGFGYWSELTQSIEIQSLYLAFSERMDVSAENRLVINQRHLRETYDFVQRLARSPVARRLFPAVTESTWSNQLVRHDAIAEGRVLFWHDFTLDTTNLWYDFPKTAGRMFEHFGVAPRPSAISGAPGTIRINPTFYVVTSESASGRRQQSAACNVLAATVNPELNARQAKAVMGLGTIRNQVAHAAFADHPLAHLAAPLLENSRIVHLKPTQAAYLQTLARFAQAAEADRLSPEAAAAQAVAEVARIYGDMLIVER